MAQKRKVTAIELIIIALFLTVAGLLFWLQRTDVEVSHRDSERKTDINAIYAHLEEVYYPVKKSYPSAISLDALPTLDRTHFTDPAGVAIGSPRSSLRYEPNRCNAGNCRGYTLRALLEKEADFIKTSPR